MIRLRFVGHDFWDRELYEDENTKKVYCSVDGQIHTMTQDYGEPCSPLREEHEVITEGDEEF